VSDEFVWVAAPWGQALQCRALEAVSHGWTSRQLQLRGSTDVEATGWAAIGKAIGLTRDNIVRLSQVHGSAVHVVAPESRGIPEADIVVSDAADRAIAVQVADCAPLLTTDRSGRFVAASHAGWRGTSTDVAGVTVRALTERYSVPADGLTSAIGPCIGPCCYEVGEELVGAFQAAGWGSADRDRWFLRREGRLYLDIWRANADQLRQAGVPDAQIHVSRLCTSCHPGWFYSFRRDGAGTGRLAGFIRPVRA
jgi:YfiH family protein